LDVLRIACDSVRGIITHPTEPYISLWKPCQQSSERGYVIRVDFVLATVNINGDKFSFVGELQRIFDPVAQDGHTQERDLFRRFRGPVQGSHANAP
jgi:hypothetical protein